jgi:hypothetical protein
MNVKMADAVTLAKIAGATAVDSALCDAAVHRRFAYRDLALILNANIRPTGAWAAIGMQPVTNPAEDIR